MTNLLRHISLLIVVLFIGNGNLWGQTFDPDDCPRGPLVRIPITSLTKAESADFMLLTDSCGNQYYTHKDSVETKGGVINQYFAGDTLITITQGDTFITIINIQGDTSGTGRFRLYDNLGVEDTITTWLPGTPTDNLNVTNGLNIDAATDPRLKWGGVLIEDTDIDGANYTHNIKWDSINLIRTYANSSRFYPKQSFILQSDNSPTMYVQLQSPTSMYLRADTVLHFDLYNHSLTDTSHLLIRTDRARDGSWVKGGFLQLLRTTSGIHQGEADWSLYALPTAVPDSAGNYVLNYNAGSKTFNWAEESGGGGIGGSGTLNYIPKWTPDGNTLGNSSIYETPVGSVYFPTNMFCSAGSWYFTSPTSGLRIVGSPMSINPNITIGANGASNTNQKLIVRGNGTTSATHTQEWQNSAGTTIGWKRDDGAISHLSGGGIPILYATFDVMNAVNNKFNWSSYVGNYFYRTTQDSIYQLGTSDKRWNKLFTKYARITDNDGTPTTIMGRDADGDVGTVAIGSGLTFAGGSLSADPTSLLYWTETFSPIDSSIVWKNKQGTNINATISPGGNGAFILGPVTDNTSLGGNVRGNYAVDLQLTRSAANHVASGAHSVALGNFNRASGQYGIGIGYDVDATGISSIALGVSTQSTGTQSTAIGDGAVSSGVYSVAIGANSLANAIGAVALGPATEARGSWSLASGKDGEAHLFGQRAHSSTGFATEGDNQTSDVRAWISIIGTTPKVLLVDGTASKLTLTVGGGNPNSRVWNARIQVVASTTDTGNGSGTFGDTFIGNYEVGIKNILGTTSLVGSGVITNSIAADAGMAGASVTITANNADDSLDILFTPPTSAGSTTETYVTATIYLTEMAY